MLLDLIERATGEYKQIETDNFQDLSIFAIDKARGLKRLQDGSLVKCPLGIQEEVQEDLALIKARSDYFDVFGKEVPNNKKNDLERIIAKVNETLTPVN